MPDVDKHWTATIDRGTTPDFLGGGAVLVIEKVGNTRGKTPEGFLLIEGVPIARTGSMIYTSDQLPMLEPDERGAIEVSRGPEDLFHEDTIASFNGKPITVEHPPERYVTPATWREFARGVCLNPRRGTGADQDVLLADLLIAEMDAIMEADARKEWDVSAGYTAKYTQDGYGRGLQKEIIGNHVALVSHGRCGGRCGIGDSIVNKQEQDMTQGTSVARTSQPSARKSRLSQAFAKIFNDMGEQLASELDEGDLGGGAEGGGVHVHVHAPGQGSNSAPAAVGGDDLGSEAAPAGTEAAGADDPVEARFQSIENGQAEMLQMLSAIAQKIGLEGSAEGENAGEPGSGGEAPPDNGAGVSAEESSGDKLSEEMADDPEKMKKATGDSAALEPHYRRMLADAEILVPGFAVTTFDSKSGRHATVDAMCGTRRRVLSTLSATVDGQKLLHSVSGSIKAPTIDSLGCPEVARLFRAAAGAKALMNQVRAVGDAGQVPTNPAGPKKPGGLPVSVAEIAAIHDQAYGRVTATKH